MKILAFDTSTEACVVGLSVEGEILEYFSLPEKKQTQILLPIIEDLLNQASLKISGLDAIAYGQGPGAFTGVRLAVSVAQGLGFSADVPVIGISTLAAVAQHANTKHQAQNVLVAMDARMGEVYFGAYQFTDSGHLQHQSEEEVISLGYIPIPQEGAWVAAGTGWDEYPDDMPPDFSSRVSSFIETLYPDPASLLKLAKATLVNNQPIPATQAIPVYLRNNVVRKPD